MDSRLVTLVERRAATRHGRPLAESLVLRIRPGHPATVLDVSDSGALIETGCRLLPSARIELRLEAGGQPLQTRAFVVRSSICRLGKSGPIYESALQFAHPLALNVAASHDRD